MPKPIVYQASRHQAQQYTRQLVMWTRGLSTWKSRSSRQRLELYSRQ